MIGLGRRALPSEAGAARRIAADETAVAQARAAAASSGEWSAVSERPTTGDFVLLLVGKNDLSAADICEVMRDDEDDIPYTLKQVGTSSFKQYFREPDVQKILCGGRASSSSGGSKPVPVPGAVVTRPREIWKATNVVTTAYDRSQVSAQS